MSNDSTNLDMDALASAARALATTLPLVFDDECAVYCVRQNTEPKNAGEEVDRAKALIVLMNAAPDLLAEVARLREQIEDMRDRFREARER